MPPESPNPYQPPRTEDCLAEAEIVQEQQAVLPPLAAWRLAVAAVLATIAWGAFWSGMNDHFFAGALVTVICWQQIPKLLDPDGLRNRNGSKPLQRILLTVGTAAFIGWLFLGDRLPDPTREALSHPFVFGIGWVLTCSYLLSDWWKRRNNPPYLPKPHAELPTESPWKPLPRR